MNITKTYIKKPYAERKIIIRNNYSYAVGIPKEWIHTGRIVINKNVKLFFNTKENTITIKF